MDDGMKTHGRVGSTDRWLLEREELVSVGIGLVDESHLYCSSMVAARGERLPLESWQRDRNWRQLSRLAPTERTLRLGLRAPVRVAVLV